MVEVTVKEKIRVDTTKDLSEQNSVAKDIEFLVNQGKKALSVLETFNQEKIDFIVHEMAMAGLNEHMPLAKMAVEETGRGIYEDKCIKNMFATEYVYHSIKYVKTVGVISEDEENITESSQIEYINIVNNFPNNKGLLIKFYSSKDSEFMASLVIPIELGTSENMAKFAITSNTIQGWVDDSKMIFSADGLKISNGNFQIVSSDESGVETSLFSYDGKALYVEGNGTFTGKIVANEGEFTGEVTAESGSIGGFIIE